MRDLHKLRSRETLSETELEELSEIRQRLRRADTDSALLFVLESRSRGGFNIL